MLSGYRTYICSAVIIFAVGAHSVGLIDDSVFKTVLEIFAAGAVAFLRAAVSKNA